MFFVVFIRQVAIAATTPRGKGHKHWGVRIGVIPFTGAHACVHHTGADTPDAAA